MIQKMNYDRDKDDYQSAIAGYILLWLLGVPARMLLVIFLSKGFR